MPSTTRRRVFVTGAVLLAGSVAGCGSVRRTGVKYTLLMNVISSEEPIEEPIFRFETVSSGERDVIESAIEDGTYTEGYVSWNDVPNRTPISEPFKSIILRLADHERSTAEKDLGTPRLSDIDVDTFSTYEGILYETRVTSDSAE